MNTLNSEYNALYKKTMMKAKIENYVAKRYELKTKFIKECFDDGWNVKEAKKIYNDGCDYDILVYCVDYQLALKEK